MEKEKGESDSFFQTSEVKENENPSENIQSSEETVDDQNGYNIGNLRQKYPEKTVLTWVYNDIVSFSDEKEQQINKRLIDLGSDCLVDFVQVLAGDYESQINKMIESETPPDMICAGLFADEMTGTYKGLLNNWFQPLDEYFTDTDEGLKLWNSMPEKFWDTMKFSGHYYGVCTYLPVSHNAYYVNKELMEKYGITRDMLEGKPLNELQNIFQMVQDGEGESCTILTMGSNSPFYGFFTIYRDMMEPYGNISKALVLKIGEATPQIQNLYETQEASQWFHMIASYRKLGLFDGGSTKFLLVKGSDHFSNYTENIKKTYENSFGNIDNIEVIEYSANELMPQVTNLNGVCVNSANMEKAMETFCICMTDSVISDLFIYGIEGLDYERVDGCVNLESRALMNILSFGNVFTASRLLIEKDYPSDYWEETVNEMYSPAMSGVILDLRDCKEHIDEINSVLNSYWGLNTGNFENVDEVLNELNKKLHEAGIDEVLQEANRQLREALK